MNILKLHKTLILQKIYVRQGTSLPSMHRERDFRDYPQNLKNRFFNSVHIFHEPLAQKKGSAMKNTSLHKNTPISLRCQSCIASHTANESNDHSE